MPEYFKATEDFQTTEDFAKLFKVKPATVRRGLCVNGHYLGIQPIKLPNGRLLWPTTRAKHLLGMEAS